MWSDPVADMLTRIRNAIQARHDFVEIPASKLKEEIARILHEEGYVDGWERRSAPPQDAIRIKLRRLPGNRDALSGLKRVSKPGTRVYVSHQKIPKAQGGLGVTLLSTSRGVMTGRQARHLGLGGEVLCQVW